jgi:hypothetical protein
LFVFISISHLIDAQPLTENFFLSYDILSKECSVWVALKGSLIFKTRYVEFRKKYLACVARRKLLHCRMTIALMERGMTQRNKPAEHDVAYAAAIDGLVSVGESIAVVGRYWWNLQMRLLVFTGTIGLFKKHWWLFLIVGFLLMAFILPLGLAFVVSAFCAGLLNPEAEDNYIVPLKQKMQDHVAQHKENAQVDVGGVSSDEIIENLMGLASIQHMLYLRSLDHRPTDKEFSAAALGSFDGTLKARQVELPEPDMLMHGAIFIANQLKNLGRFESETVNPEWLAEVTSDAMFSEDFEGIRREAGLLAYTTETLI